MCLVFMGYLVAKIFGKIDFVKLLVLSVCGFFFLYTVVSAVFFWLDCFSFQMALLDCLAVEVVAGLLVWRKLPPAQVTYDYRRSLIPLVIVLCALPFVWTKFELYSMGQDQGTYQVKALYLMERDTHNYIEMEEFRKLDTPEERQKYLDFIYDQNNLYLPRVEWETDYDASHFDRIVGTIHGLPTYSALLGLWGTIFGYQNMIGVQTPLYLCIIFLSFYICENLGFRKRTGALVTALMAGSPIMVWLAKSSLTETGITLLICAFLYLLTADAGEERYYPSMCMIPVIVFSFFHISLFAFMPIILPVLSVMYLVRRRRGWLAAIAGSTIGYAAGSLWAFDIAPYYSYGNYSELGRVTGGILSETRLVPVILAVTVAVTALCLVFALNQTAEAWLFAAADRIGEKHENMTKVSFWILRLFLILSLAFFVYQGVIKGEHTTSCEYLQISAYIYMSGIILIPFLYLVLFFRPKLCVRNVYAVNITLMFLYCIVVYSMVMRVRILFYYYFARYAALFLIVIFLLAALVLEQGKTAALTPEKGDAAVPAQGKGKTGWQLALLGAAFLTFIPYDAGLLTQKDHSRCEWEFLGDICEDITERDAFVVGPEEQQIVFIFPVKILTGCDVYYADEKLDEQLSSLAQKYEHVYYMDYDTAFEDNWGDSGAFDGLQVKKTYTNWNHLSYLDYFNITNPFTPIPLNYVEYRLKLSLYEIGKEVSE